MKIGTRRARIGLGAATAVGVLSIAAVASACVATTNEAKLKIRHAATGLEARSAKAGAALVVTGQYIEKPLPYQVKLFVDPLRLSGSDKGYYDGSTNELRRRCGDTGIPQVVAQAVPMNPTQPHLLFGYKFVDTPFVLDPGPVPGHAHFCANPAWSKAGDPAGVFLENYVYSPFDVYVL